MFIIKGYIGTKYCNVKIHGDQNYSKLLLNGLSISSSVPFSKAFKEAPEKSSSIYLMLMEEKLLSLAK